MTTTETNIRPEFRIYVRPVEASNLADDFRERCGGGLSTVYLVDMNRHVHCCEITPSYECHPIGFVPAVYPDDDAARESLMTELDELLPNEDVTYFHVPGFPKKHLLPRHKSHNVTLREWRKLVSDNNDQVEDAYKERLEAVLEYLRGNPCW